MKTHMRTVHAARKDFKCPECGKAFGYASHMKTHMRTVHAENAPN